MLFFHLEFFQTGKGFNQDQTYTLLFSVSSDFEYAVKLKFILESLLGFGGIFFPICKVVIDVGTLETWL